MNSRAVTNAPTRDVAPGHFASGMVLKISAKIAQVIIRPMAASVTSHTSSGPVTQLRSAAVASPIAAVAISETSSRKPVAMTSAMLVRSLPIQPPHENGGDSTCHTVFSANLS